MAVKHMRGVLAGDYEERINAIGEEYDSLPTRGASPFVSKHGYLMREAYLLVREFRGRAGGPAVIKRYSSYKDRDRRQPSYGENPFYWGIKSIRSDFSTSALAFFASQLKYAEKHSVPPEYLIGFLLQMQVNRASLKGSGYSKIEHEFEKFKHKSRYVAIISKM